MVVYDITDIKDSYSFFMDKVKPYYASYPSYIQCKIDELKIRYDKLASVVKNIESKVVNVKSSVSDKKIWAVDVNTEVEKIYSIISVRYSAEDKKKIFKCYIPGRTSNVSILVKLMERIKDYSLEDKYSDITNFKPVLDSLISRGREFLDIEEYENNSSPKKKVVIARRSWESQFKKVKYVMKAEYYENKDLDWKYFFNE